MKKPGSQIFIDLETTGLNTNQDRICQIGAILKDGSEIEVGEIDVFGNTPDHGKLKRVYIYNSVLWGVWAAYYPDSKVLK